MKKRMYLLLCGVFTLMASAVLAYERDPVTYGCSIRLKHSATGKYLTDAEENYTHDGTSGQVAVYGGTDASASGAHWIVKGKHSGDRWNFDFNAQDTARSAIGWPMRFNQVFRLENVKTGRNLHSHNAISPITRQSETTVYGSNGNGDTNDNWVVAEIAREVGAGYVTDGYAVKLKHENTGRVLHSLMADWKQGKNEITTYAGRDDNDWWIIEIVAQPDKNTAIKAKYDESRSTKLSYWTPVFWDAETGACSATYADRRVWAHGGSRYDGGNNYPPHDHLELLAGPWNDPRVKEGPSFFVIHNADDKFKTGPINFGDKIKIMAVHGGPGEGDKAGLLLPFRYLWMHPDSRHGAGYREIVISRPEHSSTANNQAVFTLEPIIVGQEGPISSMDLVRVKNINFGSYCWTHPDSRWGGTYHELLAEDPWGKSNLGVGRHVLFEKYRFSLVLPTTVANNTARDHLVAVNKEIEEMFGPAEAAKQKALVAAAQAQLAEQAIALQAAKDDADAKERARLAALADSEEKSRALKALEAAKKTAEDAAEQAARDAATKLSAEEAKTKAEADKVARMAEELQDQLDLPIGFARIPGKKVKSIAFGLQDHEIEKTIDNKGTKEKQLIFDDFGVIILEDGSLGQYKLSVDPANPWQQVPLADASGAAIKAVAATVATDGTTYVVSEDGKLYGISWPDDTPAAMPQASKGFEAADKKAKQRKEQKEAKDAKKAKGKKGKKEGKKAKGKKGKKADAAMIDVDGDGKPDAEERDHKKGKKAKGKKAKAAAIDATVNN